MYKIYRLKKSNFVLRLIIFIIFFAIPLIGYREFRFIGVAINYMILIPIFLLSFQKYVLTDQGLLFQHFFRKIFVEWKDIRRLEVIKVWTDIGQNSIDIFTYDYRTPLFIVRFGIEKIHELKWDIIRCADLKPGAPLGTGTFCQEAYVREGEETIITSKKKI